MCGYKHLYALPLQFQKYFNDNGNVGRVNVGFRLIPEENGAVFKSAILD